jgi:hypothetical protein
MPELPLPLMDADRWPVLAGSGLLPRRTVGSRRRDGPARDAESGTDPLPTTPASCQLLLDELLAAIGRLETDFKLRWDAAQLGVTG